jgi:hypothetical protein
MKLILTVLLALFFAPQQQSGLGSKEMNSRTTRMHNFQMEVYWQKEYKLGEKIIIEVVLSNPSASETLRLYTTDEWNHDWWMTLTDEAGASVTETEYFRDRKEKGQSFGAHGSQFKPGFSEKRTHEVTKLYEVTKPGRYTLTTARRVTTVPGSPHYDERDSLIIRDIPIVVVSDEESDIVVEEQPKPVEEPASPPEMEERPPETGFPWEWLIAGSVILLGAIVCILLRRTRKTA